MLWWKRSHFDYTIWYLTEGTSQIPKGYGSSLSQCWKGMPALLIVDYTLLAYVSCFCYINVILNNILVVYRTIMKPSRARFELQSFKMFWRIILEWLNILQWSAFWALFLCRLSVKYLYQSNYIKKLRGEEEKQWNMPAHCGRQWAKHVWDSLWWHWWRVDGSDGSDGSFSNACERFFGRFICNCLSRSIIDIWSVNGASIYSGSISGRQRVPDIG